MIALKKINKRFLSGLCALIVAVALVSVGVTMAAWNASTSETNVVTIGNVKIDLIDTYTPQNNVSPGVDVEKVVSVKNIGNTSCYVRLFVKKEWLTDTGAVTDLSVDLIKPQYKSGWVKGTCPSGGDYTGYECYYYQSELAPGQTASSLFDKFVLDSGFDVTKYANYEGHIIVKAEAVQSEYVGDEMTRTGGNITDWPSALVFN